MRTVKSPEARRHEILETAAVLFAEHGYGATTIKDITTRAGIARGLFHYYFKSKDEILAAIVMTTSTQLIELMQAEATFADCPNAVAKINRLIGVVFKFAAQPATLMGDFLALADVTLRDNIINNVVDAAVQIGTCFVHEGKAAGLFRCRYPDETAEVLAHGIVQHFRRVYLQNGEMPNVLPFQYFHAHKDTYVHITMQLLEMTEPHGLFEWSEGMR